MSQPDSLRMLLRRWRHDPAPEPGFAAGVWSRIEATRRDDRVVIPFRWAFPLAASLTLLLGVGAAHQQARREHAERMADFYVRSIDPVQMVAHTAHR